jgi:hypothetical protein
MSILDLLSALPDDEIQHSKSEKSDIPSQKHAPKPRKRGD